MTKGSEKVKRWRKNTKRRMIRAMGGKCQMCSYNKCDESMHFHHLNPEQKDFGMGGMRAMPKSWKAITIELRKCVLLCGNCHGEIHAGISTLPKSFETFNEDWADYKKHELSTTPSNEIISCPKCHEDMPDHKTYCSRSCASQARGKIEWNDVDLSTLLREFPSIIKIAEHLGISDAAVHKRMKKLGLKKT